MPEAQIPELLAGLAEGDDRAIAAIIAMADHTTDPDVLVAVALVDLTAATYLSRAADLAVSARQRQVVSIATAHLRGDRERVQTLARDHLADHPNDALVRWIASRASCG